MIDSSTAWTHLERALDALLSDLEGRCDSSACDNLTNTRLATLLRFWSGHEYGSSGKGYAVPHILEPVVDVLKRLPFLWQSRACLESGPGTATLAHSRPMIFETLVVGEATQEQAAAVQRIIATHISAAAHRADAAAATAIAAVSLQPERRLQHGSSIVGSCLYRPSSAPNHIFTPPLGCTLEISIPSLSPRETTVVVANVYICPPIPLDATNPLPFNLDSRSPLLLSKDAFEGTRMVSGGFDEGATTIVLPSNALRQRVCADILAQILHESAFNVLRTQQQLGYSVSVSVDHHTEVRNSVARCVSSFRVCVQSSAYSPLDIDARISAFLSMNRATLIAMGATTMHGEGPLAVCPTHGLDDTLDSIDSSSTRKAEEDAPPAPHSPFLRIVSSLINQKQQPPDGLRDEADRIWAQIRRGTYAFAPQRAAAEVIALRTLSLRAVVALYDTVFGTSGALPLPATDKDMNCRAVVISRESQLASVGDTSVADGIAASTQAQNDALMRKLAVRVVGRGFSEK
jgi:hypothetical protein